ncbi:MAG: DUF445 domain-containing protein [Acetobacter sp.]|nr:DUF445 domain-containing protein [Acetobacter sp.]
MAIIEDTNAQHNTTYQELKRYKSLATMLLGVMMLLTLLSYLAPALGWVKESFWLEIVRAGAYAGVVGGIADWFAVVALFRRPMGLPIPHTAILPTQKDRLGRALGLFVMEQVFTEQEVNVVLQRVDLPGAMANILEDKNMQETIAVSVVRVTPQIFDYMESGRMSQMFARFLPKILGDDDFILVIVKLLRNLVDRNKHEEILSYLLRYIKDNIHSSESVLRSVIQERVREQGGRFLGWAIGGSVATRVLASVRQELERIDLEDSSLRENFTQWVQTQIDRLETDPSQARALTQTIIEALSQEKVVGWWRHVWQRLREKVESDVKNPQGRALSLVRDSLEDLAQKMRHDAVFRGQIEKGIHKGVLYMLPSMRIRLAEFIASVIAGWDAVAMADKLELRVGKDLHCNRFSGTFIGCGVGAALFALLHVVFGINAE